MHPKDVFEWYLRHLEISFSSAHPMEHEGKAGLVIYFRTKEDRRRFFEEVVNKL